MRLKATRSASVMCASRYTTTPYCAKSCLHWSAAEVVKKSGLLTPRTSTPIDSEIGVMLVVLILLLVFLGCTQTASEALRRCRVDRTTLADVRSHRAPGLV